MEVSIFVLGQSSLIPLAILAVFSLYRAYRSEKWALLYSRQTLFLGAILFLFIIWNLRIELLDGLVWHLSGMVIITLLFLEHFALIIGAAALFLIILSGLNQWSAYLPSFLFAVWLPVQISRFNLIWARHYLPKNFFVYVLFNGFFTAALIFFINTILISIGLSFHYSWYEIKHNFLKLSAMMLFPEAILTGWIITLLIIFKPDWIRSFSDEEYIQGK